MSIPELASQSVKNTLSDQNDHSMRTIIIAGDQKVGKSSLVNAFLEKNDNPRETLVMEYSFGRKSSQKPGIDKIICHVWEYGGKIEMLSDVLVSIPIRGSFFFCIMLDLSKIKKIWNTLESCIQAIQKNFSTADSTMEIIIIGGYYDHFKNFDTEIKKMVCTTLRSVALLFNAHLLFYSKKDTHLARKAKDLCYGMGFGNGILLKEKNTNFLKPLMIPRGSDTWENIGFPPCKLDEIKKRYTAKIASERIIKSDCSEDIQRTHPEPILDTLAALKYEELRCMESFEPSIKDYLFCLQ
ncbi:cytoplasmic dynein 2 light intermediate chain 1 [Zerene cesonia]|uniref:cytoplasmic dynein 2 light intermediate chain 1 n=1 Tax=Zerene cesonia TaxID=33412 RepID=UPI0018E5398E|nr:cytoplasmic dynein 2 light intermediate chain 1 [Zerene cesonia]